MKSGWNNHGEKRGKNRLKWLGSVRTWQLIVLLIIFVMLSAIFLRLNNIGMDERRNAVIVADESGDVEAVHAAVVELNKFVSHHMNTSLGGGIALQNTYDLAVQAALDAAKTPNVDSSAYAYATEACKPKIAIGGYQMYAQCVSDIVGSTPSENFRDPVLPNPASYYVRIAPPVWSFDLAGISILICLLIIFAIAVRVVTAVILRLILKFRYRST